MNETEAREEAGRLTDLGPLYYGAFKLIDGTYEVCPVIAYPGSLMDI